MAYKKGLCIFLVILSLRGENDDCMPDFFDELTEPATMSLLKPPFDWEHFLEECPELQEQFWALSEKEQEELILAIELLNKAFVAEMKHQLESASDSSQS